MGSGGNVKDENKLDIVPKQKDNDDEEISAVKAWIATLSKDELLHAMAFVFQSDNSDSSNGAESGRSSASRSVIRGSGLKQLSHEYDLLCQMVDLQSPPSTPIHPRVVPYKSATKRGVTDGRDENERVRRNRFRRPRLYQLMERQSVGSSLYHDASFRTQPSQRQRRNSRQDNKPVIRRFDVIARKFVTPCGQVLSIGSTIEQQQAQTFILLGTRIRSGMLYELPQCYFSLTADQNSTVTKHDIMRMLHVVSYGKLFSQPPPSSDTSRTKGAPQIPFCATWLNPMDQWISLPLFLASRFEVALWDSFRAFQRHKSAFALGDTSQLQSLYYLPPSSIDKVVRNASPSELQSVITNAVQRSASSDLLAWNGTVSDLRDSMLWETLEHLNRQSSALGVDQWEHRSLHSILSVSILDVGSAKDHLRSSIQQHLQICFAQQVEQQLVKSIQSDGSAGVKKLGGRARKGGKKKNRKKNKRPSSRASDSGTKTSEGDAMSTIDELDMSSNDENDFFDNLTPPKSHPAAALSMEQSRTTIFVMSLIETILDKAFKEVGLVTCNKEEGIESKRNNDDIIASQMKEKQDTKHSSGGVIINKTITHKHHANAPPILEENNCTPPSIDDPPLHSRLDLSSNLLQQSSHQHLFSFLATEESPTQSIFESPVTPGLSLNLGGSFDGWGGLTQYQSREKSIFADFFSKDVATKEADESHIASSTAASMASCDDVDDDSDDTQQDNSGDIVENICDTDEDISDADSKPNTDFDENEMAMLEIPPVPMDGISQKISRVDAMNASTEMSVVSSMNSSSLPNSPQRVVIDVTPDRSPQQSPTPFETPPPILVSLADIGKLRQGRTSEEIRKEFENAISNRNMSLSLPGTGSLPSSPVLASAKTLTSSRSREDLRVSSLNADFEAPRKGRRVTRRVDSLLSYRNAAVRSLSMQGRRPPREVSSVNNERSLKSLKNNTGVYKSPPLLIIPKLNNPGDRHSEVNYADKEPKHENVYAQSESALDAREDWSINPKAYRRNGSDNFTTTKDGNTTISSVPLPISPDEVTALREERNSYRDMCLTLGAEVSKLKNLLASQIGQNTPASATPYAPNNGLYPIMYDQMSSFNPELMPGSFSGMPSRTRTLSAMSDVGFQRGDHDSAISEDGTEMVNGPQGGIHDSQSSAWSGGKHIRLHSSSGHYSESDASLDQASRVHSFNGFRTINRDHILSVPLQGLQSRLTKDIMSFMKSIAWQLKNQDRRRTVTIKRLSNLVKTNWPRAQVKLYGSHVSNLCLPSSDLDFVVCLPAVHKNAPAVAPGVLEGRNDINETSQKLLARKLKGESWLGECSFKWRIHRSQIMCLFYCHIQ
eukprot:scaffold39755_cov52-Attheya_sp.AAC.2